MKLNSPKKWKEKSEIAFFKPLDPSKTLSAKKPLRAGNHSGSTTIARLAFLRLSCELRGC
jgi:hypothetical protein